MKHFFGATLLFIYIFNVKVAMANLNSPDGLFIWSGISIPKEISRKQVLYLHQGTLLIKHQTTHFLPQGPSPRPGLYNPIYLTIRIQTLNLKPSFHNSLRLIVESWRSKGANIVGIQLDFDSPTSKLDLYADFLEEVRQKLPPLVRLSITGLADWASSGDQTVLRRIRQSADEVVFQLYNGRQAIPDLNAYIKSLSKLKQPFKIGLLKKMDFSEQRFKKIVENKFYRGHVWFLLREDQL